MRKKKSISPQTRTWSTDTNGYRTIRLEWIANRYRAMFSQVYTWENNTASDVVKGLHRTQKGGFEQTSTNPTGSAAAPIAICIAKQNLKPTSFCKK